MSSPPSNPRPRLLLAHGFWGRTGAELDAMWLMQALQEEFRLTLISRGGWDLPALNRCAGTRLSNLTCRPLPFARLLRGRKFGAIWDGIYRRHCRKLALEHDLQISLSGCLDWGRPAVHRLSDVLWHPALRAEYGETPAPNAPRRVLARCGNFLAGSSGRTPERLDRFVANSHWAASVSAPHCARQPAVLYPAVPSGGEPLPWSEREDSFVCLGRIAPEKRIEQVIAILTSLRARAYPIRLHLVGPAEEPEYGRGIQNLCEQNRAWIQVHGFLEAEAKHHLLNRCRYGLSACTRETFGIATAEMMTAGIVPFVPRQGAQPELVEDATLIYRDAEEAVTRIESVLQAPRLQQILHQAMMLRAEAFRPELFCKRARQIVRSELAQFNAQTPAYQPHLATT